MDDQELPSLGGSARQRDTYTNITSHHGHDDELTQPRHSLRGTIFLAFQSLGVVFGDVGTSPLYVFSSIFPDPDKPPSKDDIIGALSMIIWSLLLVVCFKYCVFILTASHQGEGGNFSLYALIAQGRAHKLPELLISILAVLNILGVSMLLGDGILTPAISVLSALEGLEIAAPSLHPAVVPLTVIVLLALFFIQSHGSSKIGVSFSPIVSLWFLALAGTGIFNLTISPEVLAAFSPHYAMRYFIRHGLAGWESLGAVVLCVTGVEALYADMGHFSRQGIRLSSLCVVIPSLLFAYAGQAAVLVTDPTLVKSAFYLTVPTSMFYPMLVLATLATVIASQAMISASYSIVHLAMQLECFPRVTVLHTSKKYFGQIYVPEINYLLMVLVLIVVLAFQSSAHLAAAYGIAVCTLMLITTFMFSLAIYNHFGHHWGFSVVFFLFFGLIDSAFWTSNIIKIEFGGWVVIIFAAFFSIIMLVYRWGRAQLNRRLGELHVPAKKLFVDTTPPPSEHVIELDSVEDIKSFDLLASGANMVAERELAEMTALGAALHHIDHTRLARGVGSDATPAFRVLTVLTTRDEQVPVAFSRLASMMSLSFDCVLFIRAHVLNTPYSHDGASRGVVDVSTDLNVFKVGHDVYALSLAYGYADVAGDADVIVQRTLGAILQRFAFMRAQEAMSLVHAENIQIAYLNCKEDVSELPNQGIFHMVLVALFKALLRVSRSMPVVIDIDAERIIEVGMTIPI